MLRRRFCDGVTFIFTAFYPLSNLFKITYRHQNIFSLIALYTLKAHFIPSTQEEVIPPA